MRNYSGKVIHQQPSHTAYNCIYMSINVGCTHDRGSHTQRRLLERLARTYVWYTFSIGLFVVSKVNCFSVISDTASPSQPRIIIQHASGRRWKNRRRRQTFLPSPIRDVSIHDEDALFSQLGYVPPNICHVSARSGGDENRNDSAISTAIDTSSSGIRRPIAIKSYPLLMQLDNTKSDNEHTTCCGPVNCSSITPFPTLYWLTCPHVSKAISELERQGYVRTFQDRLGTNKELANEWWECHEEYANERWNILSGPDKSWLLQEEHDENEIRKRKSMKDILQYSGVAGTDHRGLRESNVLDRDNFVASVKCLHSHYAHYRSQLSRLNNMGSENSTSIAVNLVGQWTHELLLENFPDMVL